jgi:hypothetical protein
MLDAGYWLLVTGCWALVTGYWVLGTGYWMLVAGYWSLVSGYLSRNSSPQSLHIYRGRPAESGRKQKPLPSSHLLNLSPSVLWLLDAGCWSFV